MRMMNESRESCGWWAVYTKHQHEAVVKRVLEAKGVDVFLPVYQEVRRWKDRMKSIELALFPGYLFVRDKAQFRLPVLSTPGVFLIVTQGSELAVLADEDIECIRRAAGSEACVRPWPYVEVGQQVHVVRGPLSGLEGILVRRKGECRLVLSVELLHQSASVQVSELDVEPLGPSRQRDRDLYVALST